MSLYLVRVKSDRASPGRVASRFYLVDRSSSSAATYAVQSHLHERRQAGSPEGQAHVTATSLAVNNPNYTRALASGKTFKATRIP